MSICPGRGTTSTTGSTRQDGSLVNFVTLSFGRYIEDDHAKIDWAPSDEERQLLVKGFFIRSASAFQGIARTTHFNVLLVAMNVVALVVSGVIATIPGVLGVLVLRWIKSGPEWSSSPAVRNWLTPSAEKDVESSDGSARAQLRKAELVDRIDWIRRDFRPASTAIVRLQDVEANNAAVEALNRAIRLQAEQAFFDYLRKALAEPTATSLEAATAEIAEMVRIVRAATPEQER